MKTKATSQLVPGDIVAQPVSDGKGNVLVHAGAEITDALIRVLSRRGVEEVEIKEGDEAEQEEQESRRLELSHSDPVTKQKIEEMQERLNLGFHRHEGNVTMAMLYKTTVDYLTAKIASGER
ncbi:MAG: hypothetical protein L6Q71_08785 [Planctomycetes bacterium]|nr:hypothetical protein [Planctomycetota bacterium]NUQ35569.1 hypothetical protein [Planctomycetaceae bacterium]